MCHRTQKKRQKHGAGPSEPENRPVAPRARYQGPIGTRVPPLSPTSNAIYGICRSAAPGSKVLAYILLARAPASGSGREIHGAARQDMRFLKLRSVRTPSIGPKSYLMRVFGVQTADASNRPIPLRLGRSTNRRKADFRRANTWSARTSALPVVREREPQHT